MSRFQGLYCGGAEHLSPQGVGVEERDADSDVGLHLPPSHRRPRSTKPADSAPERGGLLHRHAEGQGEEGGRLVCRSCIGPLVVALTTCLSLCSSWSV